MSHRAILSWFFVGAVLGASLAGCGGKGAPEEPDASPGATTSHCVYQPVPGTAGAGGAVASGPLTAGAAEAALRVPVGTALGAYTARATVLGGSGNRVDSRARGLSGSFNPSIGIETAPRVKAVALSAGGETVVLAKVDIGLMYEALLFDVEARLGPALSGKVVLAASHSHSGWGQFSGHSGLMAGVGPLRDTVYQALLDQVVAVIEAALDARRPARLGVVADLGFDADDRITRDRRGENDALMGGPRKDDALFMIRVDGQDGAPIAAVPIYGVHGTLSSDANNLTSTDAPGAAERVLAEHLPGPAVVMHLQGAAGDVSPTGHGSLDCGLAPGDPDDPCHEWLRGEGHGRAALPALRAAWQAAGQDMRDELALEMLTRSIELGPRAETFAVRDGQLAYAGFDPRRAADGQVWDDSGQVISPIDEFNAPVGAALCGSDAPMIPNAAMPATEGVPPYASCVVVDVAGEVFSALLDVEFETSATAPICQSTRTTISALRLGEYVIGTLPGEPTVWAADLVRESSPVPGARTIVLGYAQGHVGYLLRVEDWLQGGYEPSIGFWGPLEGEYILERLIELLPLAVTDEREDGAAGGVSRVATRTAGEDLAVDDPAPMAGAVPEEVPEEVWLRSGTPAGDRGAQPAAEIARVSGVATFIWIGDDPLVATPVVTLERESAPGVFEPVRRASGRPVQDGDLIVMYTPQPLHRDGPQTHYWAVEWQAVPWLGARDPAGGGDDRLDLLALRAAVPLGRYRFAVQGQAFEIHSEPFTVVPATLGVSATRMDTSIRVEVTVHAPAGYRLLDMERPSNQPVPLGDQAVTVELVDSAGQTTTHPAMTDASGVAVIDAGAAEVGEVRVSDSHGNRGATSL